MTATPLSARANRTRSALLSAGMELLAARPVDAIAIDEFVASAGVAKGSFFNHFRDKQQFANAIAHEIRVEIEGWVGRINAGVTDPLERLAGGMIAGATYALANPQRTLVLARSFNVLPLSDHPVNAGLLNDLRDAACAGQIRLPSERAGVMYWLGSCQILMAGIVDDTVDRGGAQTLLTDMLRLGLRGLGASDHLVKRTTAMVMTRNRLALPGAPDAHTPGR